MENQLNNRPSGNTYAWGSAARAFFTALAGAKEIPFNPNWKNGTGYFDNAVFGKDAPVLEVGEVAVSVDDFGRVLGIVGTRLGNAVVFTRHSDWSNLDNPIFTSNLPLKLQRGFMLKDGALSDDGVEEILGTTGFNNIGLRLETMISDCSLVHPAEEVL